MEGKTDPQKAQLLINSIGEDLKTKYYSTERATSEDTEYKNVVKTLEGIICVSDPKREARDRFEMIMSKGPTEDPLDLLKRLEDGAVLWGFTDKKQKIAEAIEASRQLTQCLEQGYGPQTWSQVFHQ